VNTSWGPMYSDPKKYFWLMTPQSAKRGPPFGLPLGQSNVITL
jgi:hypothetical protein